MNVLVPPPLHSYTNGVSLVDAAGSSLGEVLTALDARYPGLRFRIIDEQDRIRPHIRIFLDGRLAARLTEPVAGVERVQIICALSGG